MAETKALHQNFKYKVLARPGGEGVLNCFLCGTCTAGCPVSEIGKDYNPRKIMRQILLGMKGDVLRGDEIWKCCQCHTCVAHCPQNVGFADIIRVLREMSVEEGFREKGFGENIEQLDLAARKQRLDKVNDLLSQ